MVKQGHNDGLTDEESLLWPNDHQQALRVRRVIPLFDKLGAEGVKGKMNSGVIIEFLKWCRVESKLEKRLYQYFCQAYKAQGGQLQRSNAASVHACRYFKGLFEDLPAGRVYRRRGRIFPLRKTRAHCGRG